MDKPMQWKALRHILEHSGFLLKKPRIFWRALSESFRVAVLRQRRLRIVEWIINSECDSKCVMCYAVKYANSKDTPLTPQQIGKAWEACEKQGAFIAAVEGGEPTLRKDFDEVVKALHPERNVVVIVSNSLGFTKEKIRHLKTLGVSMLHLSLNSAKREENDLIRGVQGHFDQVLRCVGWAKEAGLEVYFSSMLMHSNKEAFVEILDLAKKLKVGVSGAQIVTEGRYRNERSERLTEEDRLWIINDLLPDYADVLRFDWNTNFSGRYECPAGREKISISMYGEVMPCVCNHIGFGNVREESVASILRRMNEFPHFKEKNEKCLASFDTPYRSKYLDTIGDSPKLPISIFRHPRHPARLSGGKIVEGGQDV